MPNIFPQHIEFYHTGFCTHPACMVCRGEGWQKRRFPAMAAYIHHHQGDFLFDTGYAARFLTATQSFPERLYAWTTPVYLNQPPLYQQLGQKQQAVSRIFLSHLHADHIAGLADFPHAECICSKYAYDFALGKSSRLHKLTQGVLPSLLAENNSWYFIEDFPKVRLPVDLRPFENAYLIADGVYAIALAGHAIGQYGLWIGNSFLIADAAWQWANIAENRLPNPLTALIMHNYKDFLQTIRNLQILHQHNPDLWLIPSHCEQTLAPLWHQPNISPLER